jgi:hypothetical protein
MQHTRVHDVSHAGQRDARLGDIRRDDAPSRAYAPARSDRRRASERERERGFGWFVTLRIIIRRSKTTIETIRNQSFAVSRRTVGRRRERALLRLDAHVGIQRNGIDVPKVIRQFVGVSRTNATASMSSSFPRVQRINGTKLTNNGRHFVRSFVRIVRLTSSPASMRAALAPTTRSLRLRQRHRSSCWRCRFRRFRRCYRCRCRYRRRRRQRWHRSLLLVVHSPVADWPVASSRSHATPTVHDCQKQRTNEPTNETKRNERANTKQASKSGRHCFDERRFRSQKQHNNNLSLSLIDVGFYARGKRSRN